MSDSEHKAQQSVATAEAATGDPGHDELVALGAAAIQLIARWRREFHSLTGIEPWNPEQQDRLQAWQREHGVEPTGKIRKATILAARKAAGGRVAVDDGDQVATMGPGEPSAVPPGAAEDTDASAVKHVPRFPEGKLRFGDEIEGLSNQQWQAM